MIEIESKFLWCHELKFKFESYIRNDLNWVQVQPSPHNSMQLIRSRLSKLNNLNLKLEFLY
jgi:hypothetical protein